MSKLETVKYSTEEGEYKGQPTLTIWEIFSDGSKSQYPVISFGKKKAKALTEVMDTIKKFVEEK